MQRRSRNNCLFVYPNALRYPVIPIGLASLISVARDEGFDTGLFDATFLADGELADAWRTALESRCWDAVAIHCSSADWWLVKYLLAVGSPILRDLQCAVIIGGPHATAVPREVAEHEFVDAAFRGECEEALRYALAALTRDGDLKGTPNSVRRTDGGLVSGDMLPLIADLDELPLPAWQAFDERHVVNPGPDPAHVMREGSLETSRGCPRSCAYCSTSHLRSMYRGKGSFVRRKSVNRIVSEARFARDVLSLDFLHVVDDNFLGPIDRMTELAHRLPTEVGLAMFVQVSADTVNERRASLLYEMGVRHVGVGVEVGDDIYRREVLKKNITSDRIRAAFEALRSAGIEPWAYYMIGLPGQNDDDVEQTLRLDAELDPYRSYVSVYYPFPGTELYQRVFAEGGQAFSEAPDYFSKLPSLPPSAPLSADYVRTVRARFKSAFVIEGGLPARDAEALTTAI